MSWSDQVELDTLDFKSDLQEDYVMVRRLAMARGDAIKNTNMQEKVSRLSVSAPLVGLSWTDVRSMFYVCLFLHHTH